MAIGTSTNAPLLSMPQKYYRRFVPRLAFRPRSSLVQTTEFLLVQTTGNELNGLDVQQITPVRLVPQNFLKHRLGLRRRAEELDDLLDLVGNDGVEDNRPSIREWSGAVFGPLGRV